MTKTGRPIYENKEEKGTATWGSDLYTDGALEVWTDVNTLTNWTAVNFGPGTATLEREATIIQGGTYAAKMTASADGLTAKAIYQLKTGYTQNDIYRTTFYARKGTATVITLWVLNDIPASATQQYDWVNKQWIAYTAGGEPAVNAEADFTLTVIYQQFTSDNIPVPASGKLCIFYVGDCDVGSETTYLDTIALQKGTIPPAVTIFDYTNPSDAANFDSSDYVFKFRTTGGTPATQFGLKADGVVETSLPSLNFSGETIKVASATDDTHPINRLDLKTKGVFLAGSATGVDFKVAGQTTLGYTIPAGKTFIATQVLVIFTTVNTYTTGPTISLGTASGAYNEILNGTNFVSATAGLIIMPTLSGISVIITGEKEIKLDVDIGATATTLTGSIYLFGFLI